MLVVSPWSKGGWVNSQVFDHTSLIRFIEEALRQSTRPVEPNITPWRRAVAGDLTSVFDFKTPNDHKVELPSTAAYVPPDDETHPDYPITLSNVTIGVPTQERGIRPARALPYEFDVRGTAKISDKTFRLKFANTGRAAAVFQVRSGNAADLPRSYTVGAHRELADTWNVVGPSYDLSVYGPNGFLRSFKGSVANGTMRSNLDVRAKYDTDDDDGGITLRIATTANTPLR